MCALKVEFTYIITFTDSDINRAKTVRCYGWKLRGKQITALKLHLEQMMVNTVSFPLSAYQLLVYLPDIKALIDS